MKVKLIRRAGQAAIIEWIDGEGATHRGYVPANTLGPESTGQANIYDVAHPERGAPYGMPWGEMIRLTITPEDVEAALHQAGIWTAEDIVRDHTRALGAFQSVYARDLMQLIRDARNHRAVLRSK